MIGLCLGGISAFPVDRKENKCKKTRLFGNDYRRWEKDQEYKFLLSFDPNFVNVHCCDKTGENSVIFSY